MTPVNKDKFYAGNVYDKYGTQNPIERILMRSFLNCIKELIYPLAAANVLEVGCGEGHLASYISRIREFDIEAVDISTEILNLARRTYKNIKFRQASAYHLPYRDNSFDLVVASEVLEHLTNPVAALEECWRVTQKHCIFSVPNEPFWRIANLMRCRYLSRFGNTPGHIQNWGKNQFIQLIEKRFRVVEVKLPFLWVVVLGKK